MLTDVTTDGSAPRNTVTPLRRRFGRPVPYEAFYTSRIVPIERIQLGIGVLKLHRQGLARLDAEVYSVAHLGLFVFKAVGQANPRSVFFAGHRILDRLGATLADARNAQRGLPPSTVNL